MLAQEDDFIPDREPEDPVAAASDPDGDAPTDDDPEPRRRKRLSFDEMLAQEDDFVPDKAPEAPAAAASDPDVDAPTDDDPEPRHRKRLSFDEMLAQEDDFIPESTASSDALPSPLEDDLYQLDRHPAEPALADGDVLLIEAEAFDGPAPALAAADEEKLPGSDILEGVDADEAPPALSVSGLLRIPSDATPSEPVAGLVTHAVTTGQFSAISHTPSHALAPVNPEEEGDDGAESPATGLHTARLRAISGPPAAPPADVPEAEPELDDVAALFRRSAAHHPRVEAESAAPQSTAADSAPEWRWMLVQRQWYFARYRWEPCPSEVRVFWSDAKHAPPLDGATIDAPPPEVAVFTPDYHVFIDNLTQTQAYLLAAARGADGTWRPIPLTRLAPPWEGESKEALLLDESVFHRLDRAVARRVANARRHLAQGRRLEAQAELDKARMIAPDHVRINAFAWVNLREEEA